MEIGAQKSLVLGDSFTGKTTFLTYINCDSIDSSKPTYGCDIHPIQMSDSWFYCYELGGGYFTSPANYAILSAKYSGYVFFFDANNINSLKAIPEFINSITRVTNHESKGEYFLL